MKVENKTGRKHGWFKVKTWVIWGDVCSGKKEELGKDSCS